MNQVDPTRFSNPSPEHPNETSNRREFLKSMGLLPAAVVAAQASGSTAAPGRTVPPKSIPMPQIPFGRHSLSRLICGANPFNGGSHLSVFVNHQMRRYYTPEQVLKTLRRCQDVGINTWQASGKNIKLFQKFIQEGGRMQYLSINAAPADIAPLAKGGCIGIAHHGERTDQLFKQGKLDRIEDFLKQVRAAGLMVGVSTHMPDVVDAVESKGWDIDYYMTCIYERHRSAADLEKLLGQAPIPVGEVYLPKDPPRMFKAVRQTSRTCLAFKILAAGRLSDRKPWVEKAFRDTFASIKPKDAVIVGIYDQYSDQPAENAAYARQFNSLSLAKA